MFRLLGSTNDEVCRNTAWALSNAALLGKPKRFAFMLVRTIFKLTDTVICRTYCT